MMNNADGSIIIATAIENDGFIKGSKELENAARRAAANVKNIGTSAQVSLSKTVNALSKSNQAYAEQEQKVASLKQKLAEMSRTQVATDSFSKAQAEVTRLTKEIDKAIEKQMRFMATGGKTNSRQFEGMEYDIERLREQLTAAIDKKNELLASGGAYTGVDTSGIVAQIKSEEAKLLQMGTGLETQYADSLNRIAEAGNKAAKGTNSFSASVSKSNSNLKKGIFTVLKYGLGIRSVYVLFNRLLRAITAGMNSLATYDSETQASIYGLKGALTGLRNSLASAFAPILNSIAPALTVLINKLTAAINAVGAFFAVLSGKSYYWKANVQSADAYAASLGDAADAAGDLKKAQENLSGLDEINKWQSADTGGGGGGGGASSGGGGGGVEFVKEAIDMESLSAEWALKVKDLLFDWSDLTPENIAGKVVVGLNAVAGGVLGGLLFKNVGGVLVGTIAGATLGIITSDLLFDGDGEISRNELADMIAAILVGAVGGLIGVAAGGPFGALIGFTVGADLAVEILKIKIHKGKDNEQTIKQWWDGIMSGYEFGYDPNDGLGGVPLTGDKSGIFGDLSAKLIVSVEKAKTWVSEAWEAAKMKKETVTRDVKQGVQQSSWNSDAWEAAKMKVQTITRNIKQGVQQSSWNSDALEAAKMKKETVKKKLQQAVSKSSWNSDAWETAKMKAETITRNIRQGIQKASSWVADAWEAAKMKVQTITRTIKQSVQKSTWITDAWTAAQMKVETIARELKQSLTKGTWNSDAFDVFKGKSVSSVSVGVSLWKNGWTSLQNFIGSFSKTISLSISWGTVSASTLKGKVAKALWGSYTWPSIRFAARGGIVDAATLFGNTMVGEAGKEAIIPLENHTEWIGMVAKKLLDYLHISEITPVLADIPVELRHISASIEALSKIDIPKPAMATGTITPPRASESSGELSAIRDILSGSAFGSRGISGATGEQGNRTYIFEATINGRTLFKEMVNENNMQELMTGRPSFAKG